VYSKQFTRSLERVQTLTKQEANVVLIVWKAQHPVSRREIARALGIAWRSFNPDAVKRLVEAGWIVQSEVYLPNHVTRFEYSAPPDDEWGILP